MNKKVLIISLIILIIDQLTKILVSTFISSNSIVIIPNFFYLTFARNTGAAWSILNNNQLFLIALSVVLFILLFIFKKNFKNNNRNNIAFALLYGGIWGNLLNRIFNGYVIDFLDFKIFDYDYPIFNIADIAIVIGIILLVVAIIKGEDNEVISRRRNK
ncbi:MAG: signal peptidase II [Bacilli bacterium]|nr:signal peptidase II [Bacilli bacterium]